VTSPDSPTVNGPTVERHWTTLAVEVDGELVPDARGLITCEREAWFAFRADAEAWVVAQRAEGFAPAPGSAAICSLATRYFWPTDSPTNAWCARVERVAA
jgi:hypothetical protein